LFLPLSLTLAALHAAPRRSRRRFSHKGHKEHDLRVLCGEIVFVIFVATR
jgi:hypothetical protein